MQTALYTFHGKFCVQRFLVFQILPLFFGSDANQKRKAQMSNNKTHSIKQYKLKANLRLYRSIHLFCEAPPNGPLSGSTG